MSQDEREIALTNIRSQFVDAMPCLRLSPELEQDIKEEVMRREVDEMQLDYTARRLGKHVISDTMRQDLQKVELAYRAYCIKEANVRAVRSEEKLRVRNRRKSRSRLEPAIDASTAIIIETDQIPYRHTITAAKQSILLQLDELSLTVDFVGGILGYLLVTEPCSGVENRGCSIVAVEEIPTKMELQLDCSSGSDRLTVNFRKGSKDIICVMFVWESRSEASLW
jgi:hypothetical protein